MHKSLQEHLQALKKHQESNGSRDFPLSETIRFKGVRFSYPQQKSIFIGLNVSFEPHTVVALVGKSGCGKSTILDLLLGLFTPQEGHIYYGDVPHEQLNKDSFRRQVAFVGQRPSLIDGTLRANLALVKITATDAQIFEVCQKVHLKELIDQLPEGLDTMVGENGIKLSGGQRQKISLARCLLVEPQILILDEATSELDIESEVIIQNTLRQMRSQMMTIIVAHRLSTVKTADKIYVIEEGQACESGTYDQLIGQKGKFYDLVGLQH